MKFLVFVLLVVPCLVLADWEAYKNVVSMISHVKNDQLISKRDSVQTTGRIGDKFPCKPIGKSPTVPTSVHKLRPGDIKVIGAIGDSLTAANGAASTNVIEVLNEYRGLSWSIGGDKDALTIPNMLKNYNPNLIGFSTGVGKWDTIQANLNQARPGDTTNDLMEQAIVLVQRIKENEDIDLKNDWKLITLFIGGNDLCKFCKDRPSYTPVRYINNLREVLNYLRSNLPRTLVNLVTTIDITGIATMKIENFVCRLLHNALCDCGLNPEFKQEIAQLVEQFQRGTNDLVQRGEFDTTDDFTVVIQPFMSKMTPPKLSNGNVDFTFFSQDCFHFSKKGHRYAAIELWNNMFERVGAKSTSWVSFTRDPVCPTEASPYIYTNKNSN